MASLAKGAPDCQYHSGIEKRILKSGRMYHACNRALHYGCDIQVAFDIKINLLIKSDLEFPDPKMIPPKMTPQVTYHTVLH